MSYEEVSTAVEAIAKETDRPTHAVAAVLGSGLSAYAASLEGAIEIPYNQIPGFPLPSVEGHAGSLFSVEGDGVPVMLLAGRIHAYEGHPISELAFGVRCAIRSGCDIVVLTNAAGSVNDNHRPGDLVIIKDHINLTGLNPLAGTNDERFGPRFPDMTTVYPRELRELTRVIGSEIGMTMHEGVYAWFLGPSYETPAEVEMARTMGADLVGMSTVPEAIAANHMGARVLGISLVTNLAAGMSDYPLSHQDVQDTADRAQDSIGLLLDRLLPRLGQDA